MSYRYMNPGYAEWLDTDTGHTVRGVKYNPYEGVAFYQPVRGKGIVLPMVPKEIYMRGTLWLQSDKSKSDMASFRLYVGESSTYNGIRLVYYEDYGWQFNIWIAGERVNSYTGQSTYLVDGARNEFLLYMKQVPGSGNGYCKLIVNGHTLEDSLWSKLKFGASNAVEIVLDDERTLLSNFIVSDSAIDARERVLSVPITSIDTNMAQAADGTYTAGKAGDFLLCRADASGYMERLDASSAIKNVSFSCLPATYTAEDTSKLTFLKKKSDGEAEAGESAPLSTDDTIPARLGSPVDMTLGQLADWQFGFKAGV